MAHGRRRQRDRTGQDRSGQDGGLREHWRRDGQPKARFASEVEANRSALYLRLEAGADLDPYRCQLCRGWHLGNRQRRT